MLFKRVGLADAAKALSDLGQRQFAYEMAVCVCDADGSQNDAEKNFLRELKSHLGLENDVQSLEHERQADALADAWGNTALPLSAAVGSVPPVVASQANVSEAELDQSILNYAILNGALELLPQSWASVAIIPLQVKLVYRIGKAYGYEMDQGHIKEFIATVGVGLTSQYLEQFGRKLLGGLLGKLAGKTLGRHRPGRHRHGLLFRHHVCPRPTGKTLLRWQSADEHATAAGNFPGPAGPGQATAEPVSAADPAEGQQP